MGLAILAVLGYRLGVEPFLAGLGRVDAGALAAALAITAVTTWCQARRWSLLSGRLDVPVAVPAAYRACYRAQLLNATLPSGVVGDVHRAVQHGRDSRAMARGLRSVAWDRVTGQVVQAGMALGAVLLLPAPVRSWGLWLLLAAVAVAVVVHVGLPARFVRALWAEIRDVPAAPGVWQRVVLLSAGAVCGHVVVFVVAARTAGITAPAHQLVALGLVVLLASSIPLSIAGWGPREGACAWVFAASGLGASAGLEVAVVFGVMALVATLPGVLVLGSGHVVRSTGRAAPEEVGHG